MRIAAGGFTNLSRDHMDYHPDVAHYLAAKLRLFRDLVAAGGAAVISADHDCSQAVIDAARARDLRIIAVGRKGDGAGEGIRLVEADIDGFAQKLTLEHRGRRHAVRLPLVGEFQIENALVAAGLAIGTGSEPKAVFATLEHLEGAKGRLERVGERNGAPIFVDYAHKPDALAKALQALRPYAKRKLVVVFGAGGDRDAGKRPLMGAIAAENADSVIVTDDNPRSENPDLIRAAILSTAKGAKEIGDRAEAIRTAIAGAAARRCAADRRQGPRDRTDRRRPHACRSAITMRLRPRLQRGSHERSAVVDLRRDGASDARFDQRRVAGSGVGPFDRQPHHLAGRSLFRDQGRRPRRARFRRGGVEGGRRAGGGRSRAARQVRMPTRRCWWWTTCSPVWSIWLVRRARG